jgi:hypothetical protein
MVKTEIKIDENIIVRNGDAVIFREKLYFAIPLEMGSKIMFVNFKPNGETCVWDSVGMPMLPSLDQVKKHFNETKVLEFVSRDSINMTIETIR